MPDDGCYLPKFQNPGFYTASTLEGKGQSVGERYQSAIDDIGHMFQSGMVGMFTSALLCLPFAIIVGIVRFAIFLKVGYAPNSACETVAFFTKFNPFDCIIETDWIGFNLISTWLLFGVDASIGFLILAAIFVVLGIACIFLDKIASAMGAR